MCAAARKLATILAADIAGYGRLVGVDEEGTLETLRALRRELIDPTIERVDHIGTWWLYRRRAPAPATE